MTSHQHTPTPWTADTEPNQPEVTDCEGLLVAVVTGPDMAADEDRANAQFIVTACNAHKALVRELTRILPMVDLFTLGAVKDWSPDAAAKHAESIRAALAQVRKES